MRGVDERVEPFFLSFARFRLIQLINSTENFIGEPTMKFKIFLALSTIALVSSISGCGGSGEAAVVGPGSASGVAMNGAAPAASATVSAVYAEGPSFAPGAVVLNATTKADGSFKLAPLAPGIYSFMFSSVDPATKAQKSAQVNGITISPSKESTIGAISLN